MAQALARSSGRGGTATRNVVTVEYIDIGERGNVREIEGEMENVRERERERSAWGIREREERAGGIRG